MIGETISHYRITEKLGEGGMGVVWKAEDTRLDRPVALKFLAPHLLRDEEGRKRFRREAKAAASLDHPNICTVHEIDEADEQTFIAMAFLEGQPLSERIKQGPLKLPEALSIAVQMAEGLEAAHGKGIVHRDIKPDNVMLLKGSRGLVKIMDFGLAQLAGSSKLTRGGTTLGTVAYMSPEQAEGAEVDHRTDIWSLGAVLYEMVAGQPPFRGEFDQAVVFSIMNEPPEPLTALRTGVPQELERIVNKCLAKKAPERYQDATNLLVDLQAVRRELEPQTSRVASRPVAAKRFSPLLVGSVAALLLVAVGLTWWLTRSSEPALQPPQYKLTQLTRDTGFTGDPALSPDGRLLAYASDRGGEGNLDIWVQQVSGRDPIRLTGHEADERQPDFSPDGSQVVFQSNRDRGGIYLAPTLGGPARLLALEGQWPAFSPDGQYVAYHLGGFLRRSSIHIVPIAGGASRKLETGVPWAARPVWSPDGQYLLFFGNIEQVFANFETYDWWVVPREGGQAVRTGALDVLNQAGLRPRLGLGRSASLGWPQPERIVFAAQSGDTGNIYQLSLSRDEWQVNGSPVRLTHGISEAQPSVAADGRIAFTSLSENWDVWAVAIDANRGVPDGEPEPVVVGAAPEVFPTVSADGKKLAFVRVQSDSGDVWIRDNESREETPLVVTPANEVRAIISPDGSKVAFIRGEYGASDLFVIPTTGGVEERLAEDVETMMPWSADSRRIIYAPNDFDGWSTVDVETREVVRLLEERLNRNHSPVLSPDGRWLTFKILGEPGRNESTFIAPVRDGVTAPRSEWVRITKDEFTRRSWWSPDGNIVYFFSTRDGFNCIWARRLDSATRQPEGEQFHVFGFHEERRQLTPQAYGLARDKLYLSVQETTGNVWLAEPQKRE